MTSHSYPNRYSLIYSALAGWLVFHTVSFMLGRDGFSMALSSFISIYLSEPSVIYSSRGIALCLSYVCCCGRARGASCNTARTFPDLYGS